MLYDIQDDGQLVYAKTLVQSIYQLHEEVCLDWCCVGLVLHAASTRAHLPSLLLPAASPARP